MNTPSRRSTQTVLLASSVLTFSFFFQNCDNGQFDSSNESALASSTSSQAPPHPVSSSGDCSFNSLVVANGQSQPGYLAASPAGGTTCANISKLRTCNNGVLSGPAEYQYERCDKDAECKAPRRYTYSLAQEVSLSCVQDNRANSGFKLVFDIAIPDRGKAVARATLNFRNSNGEGIYYWASYALVGAPISAGQNGDDICPGRVSGPKSILGSGSLLDSASRVQVWAAQGRNPCVDGQVYAQVGGSLDVWVEDPRPHCQGLDIGHIQRSDRYNWTTSMTEIASLNVPVTSNRTNMMVLSSIAGTPELNPNTVCGSEAATLVAQVVAGSAVDTITQVIPASSGNGHLVLSPALNILYAGSPAKVSAFVGSNTGATTVFSGGPTSGGASLSFVKYGTRP